MDKIETERLLTEAGLFNKGLSHQEVVDIAIKVAHQHPSSDFYLNANKVFKEKKMHLELKQMTMQYEDNKFDLKKYQDLVENVGYSPKKTRDLMYYLYVVEDRRLTFASLHFLKINNLMRAKGPDGKGTFLDPNDPMFVPFKNEDLYDVLMRSVYRVYDREMSEEDQQTNNALLSTICQSILPLIGIPYEESMNYNIALWLESVLWTLGNYMKANTLKVALGIVPSEFLAWKKNEAGQEWRPIEKYYYKYFTRNIPILLKQLRTPFTTDVVNSLMVPKNYMTLGDNGYKLLLNMLPVI